MTVKEQVLLFLEKSREKAISGEELAGRLSVSRAAVWKAIKSLQKDGYAIEAVNNKGYTLKKAPDILSAAYIEQCLKKAGFTIHVKTERMVSSKRGQGKEGPFFFFTGRIRALYESFTAP